MPSLDDVGAQLHALYLLRHQAEAQLRIMAEEYSEWSRLASVRGYLHSNLCGYKRLRSDLGLDWPCAIVRLQRIKDPSAPYRTEHLAVFVDREGNWSVRELGRSRPRKIKPEVH